MKRPGLALLLFLLLPWEAKAQYGEIGWQDIFVRRSPLIGTSVQADSVLTEGKVVFTLKLKNGVRRFCVALRKITGGAQDSLLVTLQTTPNPGDTVAYPWATFSNFNGRRTTVGWSYICIPTGAPGVDSARVVFQHIRAVEDHSPGSVGNDFLAADTSSWALIFTQEK